MKKYAVIVAGGAGMRMNTAIPKQFLLLQGRPLLWHTLTAFLTAFNDVHIILVLPATHIEMGQGVIALMPDTARIQLATGGDTRYQSVKNGLNLVEETAVVFVHDGVRCLVTSELIHRCYEEALQKGNAVPAIAATDSIRIETATGNKIIERNSVRIIQTPQTFLSSIIKPAFNQAYKNRFTDEASVVETTGIAINLIEGDANNIKITRPVDLLIATKILDERKVGKE